MNTVKKGVAMVEKTQKKRKERCSNFSGGINNFATDEENGLVTVSRTFYKKELPVGGMTVGEIRARFHDHFDIPPESRGMLDGELVDDATVVQTGQALAFTHNDGEKGR